uniref:Uncharacterized protein n=1 Tax=Anguilla anguilla TaxID=7936 RepID=A0A0E9VKA1_ANGAN
MPCKNALQKCKDPPQKMQRSSNKKMRKMPQ